MVFSNVVQGLRHDCDVPVVVAAILRYSDTRVVANPRLLHPVGVSDKIPPAMSSRV